MKIETILKLIADLLKTLPEFAAVPVLEEDKGNVYAELDQKVASENVAAVVGWNGFEARAQGGDGLFGVATITVEVFENPLVHRDTPGAVPLLELARVAARELSDTADEGMTDTLHFKRITPIVVIKNGVISTSVEFQTEAHL